jgi:hypothetical protein
MNDTKFFQIHNRYSLGKAHCRLHFQSVLWTNEKNILANVQQKASIFLHLFWMTNSVFLLEWKKPRQQAQINKLKIENNKISSNLD